MKKTKLFTLLSIGLITFSCNGNKQEATSSLDTLKSTVAIISPSGSTAVEDTLSQKSELEIQLSRLEEEYKNVPNPIIAKFDGFTLGDYPHISFSNEDGSYDFGDGNNSFDGVDKDEFLLEESKLIGKTFKVYWEWKMSEFYCCSGEMEMVKGKVPSITNLELLEK